MYPLDHVCMLLCIELLPDWLLADYIFILTSWCSGVPNKVEYTRAHARTHTYTHCSVQKLGNIFVFERN